MLEVFVHLLSGSSYVDIHCAPERKGRKQYFAPRNFCLNETHNPEIVKGPVGGGEGGANEFSKRFSSSKDTPKTSSYRAWVHNYLLCTFVSKDRIQLTKVILV